ncbi:MAG: hypothetical protein FWD34_04765 [Oscillospiraceae bacterium]|nr:hypothetical protein [Oscillospiraceae bacterium]
MKKVILSLITATFILTACNSTIPDDQQETGSAETTETTTAASETVETAETTTAATEPEAPAEPAFSLPVKLLSGVELDETVNIYGLECQKIQLDMNTWTKLYNLDEFRHYFFGG